MDTALKLLEGRLVALAASDPLEGGFMGEVFNLLEVGVAIEAGDPRLSVDRPFELGLVHKHGLSGL